MSESVFDVVVVGAGQAGLAVSLHLREAGVTSIVWCTGFDADWSWVDVDVFDDAGRPKHRNGISDVNGLYFVGLPWLASRKSGVLLGVREDAKCIVDHIQRPSRST